MASYVWAVGAKVKTTKKIKCLAPYTGLMAALPKGTKGVITQVKTGQNACYLVRFDVINGDLWLRPHQIEKRLW